MYTTVLLIELFCYSWMFVDVCFLFQLSGLATAAGCQLVASCDIAVATEGSRFATPGLVSLITNFCCCVYVYNRLIVISELHEVNSCLKQSQTASNVGVVSFCILIRQLLIRWLQSIPLDFGGNKVSITHCHSGLTMGDAAFAPLFNMYCQNFQPCLVVFMWDYFVQHQLQLWAVLYLERQLWRCCLLGNQYQLKVHSNNSSGSFSTAIEQSAFRWLFAVMFFFL